MKKLAIVLTLAVGLAVLFTSLSHYFRYDLYDLAIEFEASQGNLKAHHVLINGERAAYLENTAEGKKATILMLHGFSATKENWLRFAAKLSDDYHLIALDMIGHGDSAGDLDRSYSVESQVEFLKNFLDQLDIKTLHLAGNSMGGAVATLFSATYPERVNSLILISPAGVHDIDSKMEMMLKQGINPLIAKTPADFENIMAFVMEDQPYIPSAITEVEAEKSASRTALNQKIFKDLREDLTRGLEQNFAKVKAPTLIMWGAQDRVIHVDNIKKYTQLIDNSQALILDGIGHLAMLETPSVSAKAAIDFLAEHTTSKP